jgi:uncharacterized membrane-anchored protein
MDRRKSDMKVIIVGTANIRHFEAAKILTRKNLELFTVIDTHALRKKKTEAEVKALFEKAVLDIPEEVKDVIVQIDSEVGEVGLLDVPTPQPTEYQLSYHIKSLTAALAVPLPETRIQKRKRLRKEKKHGKN